MSEVEVSYSKHVATIALNAPKRLNALSAENMASLREVFAEVDSNPEIRAIVISGTGRGFCTGAEAKGLVARVEECPPQGDAAERRGKDTAFTPHRAGVYKPVIVAVNGVCAGAGLHFVADGDIVICAESATFLDPHTSIGQVSSLEPILFAKTGIPMNAILRMVILGRNERIDASAALRLGLVTEVVPDETLMQRALELADMASQASPEATQRSIRVIWESLNYGLEDAYNAGYTAIGAHRAHPDAVEGARAFVEKRAPVWVP